MPQLDNIRHERFARYIAQGYCKTKAYALAGYTWNTGNAIALWRHKGKASQRIQNRVRELTRNAANLSAQDILDHVYYTMELALESGQCAAALKACEMLGKERGLFRDRRENININLASMTIEQAQDYLTERYGSKAQGIIDWLKENYTVTNGQQVISPDNASGGGRKERITPYLAYESPDCDE